MPFYTNHNMGKILLKNTMLFLIVILMFSCKNYRINNSNIIYSQNEIRDFVEEKHFSSNKVEDIPRCILKSLTKEGILITSDFITFNSKYANSLLLNGGTNKKENKGYLIIKTHEINKNTCILYFVDKKIITLSLYEITEECIKWDCAKTMLKPENSIIRIKIP